VLAVDQNLSLLRSRAVFVRTLKPGVTYQQFKNAWVPEGLGAAYPATARVARSLANDRQVITIIELDVPAAEFKAASASLTRSDALARLAEIVETTQLEGVYEDIFDEVSLVH
jgi:hypothetical protein